MWIHSQFIFQSGSPFPNLFPTYIFLSGLSNTQHATHIYSEIKQYYRNGDKEAGIIQTTTHQFNGR